MNILILGSGGRECAFAWKISKSPYCKQLYIAPGNGGTRAYGQNVELNISDFEQLGKFCTEKNIDLLLPGSEQPLVEGVYDYFKNTPELKHIIIAGPSKDGAQLEGSKSFAKAFMKRHEIPTADYEEFTQKDLNKGLDFIKTAPTPLVLKADGLAAGKGVVITEDRAEAASVFQEMIIGAKFGSAGERVVIEHFLKGIECSVFVLTDGKNYVLLPEAKDYKRIGEGEKGLNTGGMGAVSPVPFADTTFMNKVKERIIEPTIKGLTKDQLVYHGFIFFGLINVEGNPFVIEYNCRMGDPETEVVLPRLKDDLVELFLKMDRQELDQVQPSYDPNSATTVMLVSGGYPEKYEKGKKITGFENCHQVILFHAGTQWASNGSIKTNGGRVIAITALGNDLKTALNTSYKGAEALNFEGKYYRKDIGFEFKEEK